MKPDWKDAPEWANWLAMDQGGSWYWYEHEPKLKAGEWVLDPSSPVSTRYEPAFESHDPEGSLSCRPQTTTPQPEGQGDEGKRDA